MNTWTIKIIGGIWTVIPSWNPNAKARSTFATVEDAQERADYLNNCLR